MTARTKIITAAALLLAIAGCTDLTVEPKSTATPVFQDPNSYKAFLAKLYVGLTVTGQVGPAGNGDIQGIDEGFSSYLRQYWQLEELPTDEAIIAWGDAGLPELNTQLWATSNQFLAAMYSRIFFQVGLANEFLRQTTDEVLAQRGVTGQLRTDIQQYRAETRFLRALSYWHGLDLFGSIPLVTEATPIPSAPPQQATPAEIFSFIESELETIRADLPAAGTEQYGRAGQAAADMLLAKLYLNASVYIGQDRFADVLTALQPVLSATAYSLDPSYQHLFLADNNTSKEIIFPVPQDGIHTQTYGGVTFLTHAPVGGNMNANDFGIDGGWWGLRVRKEVVGLYPGVAGPDLRASLFYTNGQSLDVSTISDFFSGYALSKYKNVTSTGLPGSDKRFPDTDFPMFRLADAYLMYAEAVLRTNGNAAMRAQALSYVNAIRTRAYGNTSGNITDAELTLSFILDERARELLWEAHRRTDLIRFNRFTQNGVWQWKGNVLAGTTTDAHLNLYPIPASEIVANPNMQQNPGY